MIWKLLVNYDDEVKSQNRGEYTLIIVEGPDGSGKTTLVDKLLSNPDLRLEKGDRACTSDNGAIDDLSGWVDRQLQRSGQERVLYDRHPLISDIVYGPLIRGGTSPKFNDFVWLHTKLNQLKNLKPMVIYCLPDKRVVEDNVQANHEGKTAHLRGVLRTSGALYDLYVYHAAMSPFYTPTWVWDYERSNFSDLCMAVRSNIGH